LDFGKHVGAFRVLRAWADRGTSADSCPGSPVCSPIVCALSRGNVMHA
jgi:hypothetical protein